MLLKSVLRTYFLDLCLTEFFSKVVKAFHRNPLGVVFKGELERGMRFQFAEATFASPVIPRGVYLLEDCFLKSANVPDPRIDPGCLWYICVEFSLPEGHDSVKGERYIEWFKEGQIIFYE